MLTFYFWLHILFINAGQFNRLSSVPVFFYFLCFFILSIADLSRLSRIFIGNIYFPNLLGLSFCKTCQKRSGWFLLLHFHFIKQSAYCWFWLKTTHPLFSFSLKPCRFHKTPPFTTTGMYFIIHDLVQDKKKGANMASFHKFWRKKRILGWKLSKERWKWYCTY